ncbi:MAG: hypothetical protein IJX74_03910 [Clostridia bacterium]|nr:hypothetical protein [Clostridia bacterium]
MTGSEKDLLFSRLDDNIKRSERGEIAYTAFLSPADLRTAEEYLLRCGRSGLFFTSGGYAEAERARVFMIPEYMYGVCDGEDFPRRCQFDELTQTLADAVTVVEIRGSGYRQLSHRDYLGSILALGVERDAVGDVAVTGNFSAVAVTSRRIAEFLSDELKRVASDAVKLRILPQDERISVTREIKAINDTVASGRLDCIISALTGMSRESAQNAIKAGLVEVDHRSATAPDLQLCPPATITVRGYGKYILYEFAGETKKGRLRISAGKYV